DLLALLLALFSVSLSVAFYFKTNETSNQFYDNTYKFTKDMAEILGRIEAGFGERLRHLDEGYNGMRERLDRLPYQGAPTASEVQQEEEVIRLKEAEQRAVIEELAQKAQLANHEKKALFEDLAKKSEELELARLELRKMQTSRHEFAGEMPKLQMVLGYVARRLQSYFTDEMVSGVLPGILIRQVFTEHKSELANDAIDDLKKLGLLDQKGKLTNEAILILRQELKRIHGRS
ncbi:hypothetical protein, partial [Achromobacter sp. AGC25]